MEKKDKEVSRLQMGKKTKTDELIEWIDAFITLQDLSQRYFEMSIEQGPPLREYKKQMKFTYKYSSSQRRRFRETADRYDGMTNQLIKMHHE